MHQKILKKRKKTNSPTQRGARRLPRRQTPPGHHDARRVSLQLAARLGKLVDDGPRGASVQLAARLRKLVDLSAVGLLRRTSGLPHHLPRRISGLLHRRAAAQHLRPVALELRLSRSRGKRERRQKERGKGTGRDRDARGERIYSRCGAL